MRTRRWFTAFALLGLVFSSGCCCPCWGERRFCHRPLLRPCSSCGCSVSVSGYPGCNCGAPVAPLPYIAPAPYITPAPITGPMPKAVPTFSFNP